MILLCYFSRSKDLTSSTRNMMMLGLESLLQWMLSMQQVRTPSRAGLRRDMTQSSSLLQLHQDSSFIAVTQQARAAGGGGAILARPRVQFTTCACQHSCHTHLTTPTILLIGHTPNHPFYINTEPPSRSAMSLLGSRIRALSKLSWAK